MKTSPRPSQRRLRQWKRRQRKKHHVGEFQELGFALEVRFHAELDDAACDAWLDALIEEVERMGLAYGGGDTGGFVSTWERGSVTLAQRDALLAWVRSYPGVSNAKASELLDAWRDDSWVAAL
ncbi:YggL family protein [Chromobacterium amazonense]|uniref:YggL family protein n=1 Tax=Chromobacterium amazonense TaxID=1382803 RepID=A0ABU8UW05_9NEIS|nr:YggL family protein [Chromobacterium amazonense]MDQ4542414.1 YggL family protein [Chromobacterium amazonense]